MYSHRGRRFVRHGAVAAVLALVLAACGDAGGDGTDNGGADGGDGAPAGEPKTGGDVVVGSITEMPGFDPIRLTYLGNGNGRAAQVMDTLMYRDDISDEVKPKLAQSLDSEDGQVWTLTLREGVEFTDGTLLDADAVVFNLERHIEPDSISSAKSMLEDVESIEATGEYEVTISLAAPSGSFPLTLTGSSPAGLIGSPAALADPETFNSAPVGAGPFMFESWVRDSELKLVPNDDYFVEGQPYLDSLSFRSLPENQARTDAIMSGDVALVQLAGSSWASVEDNPEIELVPSQVGGQALVINSDRAPGDDERVREAIGLSIDPATVNDILFPGSEVWDENRDCLPFADESPACLEGAAPTPDIDRAKELIADYVADGGTTEVVYSAPQFTDEIEHYQSQLTEIGLDVEMRVSDAAAWLEDTATGDYDLLVGVNGSSGYPTQWRYMYSEGFNWGQVVDPELDDALLRARDELELDDRNEAWRDVSQIVTDTRRLFWVSPFNQATAYSADLQIGSEEFPFLGTLMVYYGEAWLEQ